MTEFYYANAQNNTGTLLVHKFSAIITLSISSQRFLTKTEIFQIFFIPTYNLQLDPSIIFQRGSCWRPHSLRVATIIQKSCSMQIPRCQAGLSLCQWSVWCNKRRITRIWHGMIGRQWTVFIGMKDSSHQTLIIILAIRIVYAVMPLLDRSSVNKPIRRFIFWTSCYWAFTRIFNHFQTYWNFSLETNSIPNASLNGFFYSPSLRNYNRLRRNKTASGKKQTIRDGTGVPTG